ncbi:MAG: tail fiber domain-containing protein, partial [Guyparkeria sp.]
TDVGSPTYTEDPPTPPVRAISLGDDIQRAAGGLAGMEYGTVVTLLKRTALSGNDHRYFLGLETAGGDGKTNLWFEADDELTWGDGDGTNSQGGPAAADTTSDWLLVVTRKPTGTEDVYWSVQNRTTKTWDHGVGDTPVPDSEAIGSDGIISLSFESNGDSELLIAAQAVWSNRLPWAASSAGNTAIEQAGLGDSLANWDAEDPDAGWRFNQQSTSETVDDWTGNGADQISITGTTVVTDDAPPDFDFSLDGESDLSGSGEITAPAATMEGTGTVAVSGSGELSAAATVLSGGASVEVSGAGAITAPAARLSGTGSVLDARTGSGAITAPAAKLNGTAAVRVSGSGTLRGGRAALAGTAETLVSGAGAITAPAAKLSGALAVTPEDSDIDPDATPAGRILRSGEMAGDHARAQVAELETEVDAIDARVTTAETDIETVGDNLAANAWVAAPNASDPIYDYPVGLSVMGASTDDGWPEHGIVTTWRLSNDRGRQELKDALTGGDPDEAYHIRSWGNGSDEWSDWSKVVLQNSSGDVSVSSELSAWRLRLEGTADASMSSTDHAFQVGSDGGRNLVIDNNEVLVRDNGGSDTLWLNHDSGPVRVAGSELISEGPIRAVNDNFREHLKLERSGYHSAELTPSTFTLSDLTGNALRVIVDGETALMIGSNNTALPADHDLNYSGSGHIWYNSHDPYNNGSAPGLALTNNPSLQVARDGIGIHLNKLGSGGGTSMSLRHQGDQIGRIRIESDEVWFETTSDVRKKQDVADLEGSLDRVRQLRPVSFNWRKSGKAGEGLIAEEVQQIVPNAVGGQPGELAGPKVEDDDPEEGSVVPQTMDYSKLVPVLIGAVRELAERVDFLESQGSERV